MPHTRQYRCEACGGTFDEAWTEGEANAEAEVLFGVVDASTRADMARVCDDCYRLLMADLQREGES
jgi:rubredoxin